MTPKWHPEVHGFPIDNTVQVDMKPTSIRDSIEYVSIIV